jgi:hypothetical protein
MSKSHWLKDEKQNGNFSNDRQDTFDPKKRYIGIRLQQGVPLLDRDWNELEDMRRHAGVTLRRCYIGSGTPDDGFRISLIDASTLDFRISSGRCLVDGFDVVNEPYDESGNKLDFLLYSQQEGVPAITPLDKIRDDMVYLDVWVEEVSAGQDIALSNSQDIDMETCRRHKLEWRVRVDEGSQGYEKQPFHHYYDLAKIEWATAYDRLDFAVADLRCTELSLDSLKKSFEADEWVTAARIADKAVTRSKIRDGSVNEDKLSSSVTGKLVTNGDKHDHSGGDGAQIKHSSLNKDDGTNPHGTTAADVGALPITGGNVNGSVWVHNSIQVEAPDKEIYCLSLGRTDEENRRHEWKFWHMNSGYGKNSLQLWEYKTDSTGKSCDGNVNDGAMCHQRVTVAEGGNVGIGTSNPLSVIGNGSLKHSLETTGWILARGNGENTWGDPSSRIGVMKAGGSDNDAWWISANPNNTFAVHQGGVGDRLTINKSGNVGIGTTAPNHIFHVKTYDAVGLFESTGSQAYLRFSTRDGIDHRVEFCNRPVGRAAIWVAGYGDAFNVTRNGNVGIGTHIPIHKLQVEGNLHVRNWATVGSDYSEYFESQNGKTIPQGTAVVLENGKVRRANKNETPLGIISANPGMASGVHVEWPKKYLQDEFGNQITEEYQEEIMAPKKEKVKKERQKMEKKKVKEKVTRTEIVKVKGKYCQKEVIDTIEREIEEPVFKEMDLYDAGGKDVIGKHRIPVMETYEEEIDVLDEQGQPVMKGTGKFETRTRPKINPEYDETKEYIPREKRPEWNCVGLLGQLPLRKGQPVADSWVKIKDISKDVELWLVK